jgi:transcription initiation factor TFIIH subunit 2
VLVLFNSLHTTDPGNISKTIALLAREKMIVSGVSMSAEMYVCKRLSELTQGTYHVAKHYAHFQQLVLTAIQVRCRMLIAV